MTNTAADFRKRIADMADPSRVICGGPAILEALADAAIPRWRPIETYTGVGPVMIRMVSRGYTPPDWTGEPRENVTAAQAMKLSFGFTINGRRVPSHYTVTHWYPVHPEPYDLEEPCSR